MIIALLVLVPSASNVTEYELDVLYNYCGMMHMLGVYDVADSYTTIT
jgi:hypothetical protein